MKKLFNILSVLAILSLMSCASTYSTGYVEDDTYSYNSTKPVVNPAGGTTDYSQTVATTGQNPVVQKTDPNAFSTAQEVDIDGNTYYEDSSVADDYYDYEYAFLSRSCLSSNLFLKGSSIFTT